MECHPKPDRKGWRWKILKSWNMSHFKYIFFNKGNLVEHWLTLPWLLQALGPAFFSAPLQSELQNVKLKVFILGITVWLDNYSFDIICIIKSVFLPGKIGRLYKIKKIKAYILRILRNMLPWISKRLHAFFQYLLK